MRGIKRDRQTVMISRTAVLTTLLAATSQSLGSRSVNIQQVDPDRLVAQAKEPEPSRRRLIWDDAGLIWDDAGSQIF